MEKERLAFFKELLTERLGVLLKEAERTVTGMTNDKDTFPDPTDRAFLTPIRSLPASFPPLF